MTTTLPSSTPLSTSPRAQRRLWLATLLAPCWASLACGDDGNTCIGIGCNDDEVGESGGNEPIDECFPHFEPNRENMPVPFRCTGTGLAWAQAEFRHLGNKVVTERFCHEYPAWVNLADEKEVMQVQVPEECQVVSLSNLPSPPWVCCLEGTEQDPLTNACDADCGYAACKEAVNLLEMRANAIVSEFEPKQRAKADLYAYAKMLKLPAQQELCANLVRTAAQIGDEFAEIDLGEAPSMEKGDKDKPGHIENLTLYIRCDVEEIYQSGQLGTQCTESGNTPGSEPTDERDGLVFGGGATYTGSEYEGEAALVDGVIAVSVPICNQSPCTLTVTELSSRFENVQLGDIELTGVRARLSRPAQAWRDEDGSIYFPAGVLRFEVQAIVLVDGVPLSEVPNAVLHVSNAEPAIGSFGEDGTFALEQARFVVGDYEVVVHIEPSPTSPSEPL
ncbi:MAG: hypothetical protein HC927_00770 [Deltaproteobacteria bacterium]|nr:hypothetical protein [Deltaproteobacteria bacterium]